MSVRSRLLAEAVKQISNPFLLCALVSQRTRQLMMAGNAQTNTAQIVNSALEELIAGGLEFEHGKSGRPLLMRTESSNEESKGGLESPEVPLASAVTLSGPNEKKNESERSHAEGRFMRGNRATLLLAKHRHDSRR